MRTYLIQKVVAMTIQYIVVDQKRELEMVLTIHEEFEQVIGRMRNGEAPKEDDFVIEMARYGGQSILKRCTK